MQIAQGWRMHRAPFYDFFIETTFNHRLAVLVGSFGGYIRLQPNET
jgi:hypothetical protein